MSAIHVVNLAKRFGNFTAVEGLSFEVLPGEVFGLLGPNGAGKTTTVRMLAGLLRPSEGSAHILGMSVFSHADDIRQRVGLLTEQPGLYDRLSARENLEFYIRLHELDGKDAWNTAGGLMEKFGLAGRVNEPVGTFSKGMRQKLAIVRTLLHNPDVLFLDEPTSGLDPESARIVRDSIADWARSGKAIILCSHNLAEVERLCHRVAIVKNRLRVVASLKEFGREEGWLEVELERPSESLGLSLQQSMPQVRASVDEQTLRVFGMDESLIPDVVDTLVRSGARVKKVMWQKRTLEELYLQHVRHSDSEGVA